MKKKYFGIISSFIFQYKYQNKLFLSTEIVEMLMGVA